MLHLYTFKKNQRHDNKAPPAPTPEFPVCRFQFLKLGFFGIVPLNWVLRDPRETFLVETSKPIATIGVKLESSSLYRHLQLHIGHWDVQAMPVVPNDYYL